MENEFGKWGDDAAYMAALTQQLRAGGVSELLLTCDYADAGELAAGGTAGSLQALNFGAHIGPAPNDALEVWRRSQLLRAAGGDVAKSRRGARLPLLPPLPSPRLSLLPLLPRLRREKTADSARRVEERGRSLAWVGGAQAW